jgi:hypothetical protein
LVAGFAVLVGMTFWQVAVFGFCLLLLFAACWRLVFLWKAPAILAGDNYAIFTMSQMPII